MQQKLIHQIVDVLMPHVGDVNSRQALVQSALFGCPVLNCIDWTGSVNSFTVMRVRQLVEYGECKPGTPAIIALLQALKGQTGADKQVAMDALMRRLDRAIQRNNATASVPVRSITLKIPTPYPDFDIQKFLKLIAGLVEIGFDDISIVYVREGSVILTIEMPASAVRKLTDLIVASPDLFDEFGRISILTTNDETDAAYDIEAFALGPSNMRYRGSEIDSWEGHLPRLLFLYVLENPLVTREEICETFWPQFDTDQAVNIFHVTKRRLEKALDYEVLVHSEHHYQVNPKLHVYYDVTDFIATLMWGRDPNNPNPIEAWQSAVKLYRGPYLHGHHDSWIEERRAVLRSGYIEALREIAHWRIGRDEKELALKLYLLALSEDERRESLHREIMQVYHDLGRRSEAVAHYQGMQKAFAQAGLNVSAATEKVYKNIVS